MNENPGGVMDQDGMWRMVGEERQEILGLLSSLTPAQWQTPSLCAGWRVQDVAVHLLVDEPFRELGWPRGLTRLAGMGFSVHRANAWVVQHNAARDTADIVAIWQRSLPPGPVARLLGAGGCLRAGVIHHQDMRRPLGMPRVIPAERLKGVLDAIITPKGSVNLGSRQRAAGLRLTATDADWAHGDGPRIEGRGEALIMALAGRAAGLAELKGDGLPILQARTRAPAPAARLTPHNQTVPDDAPAAHPVISCLSPEQRGAPTGVTGSSGRCATMPGPATRSRMTGRQ